MTTSNHDNRRQVQRDARTWAQLTGTNYTTALREVASPLTQGILGDRITVAQLMQALDTYPDLGEFGVNADKPYRNADGLIFGGKELYSDVILAAEFLQMFTPAAEPATGSYSLKHKAEEFLKPVRSYITNGQLIWAAAAIGLPISRLERDNPNVEIGVSELEYSYARGALRGVSSQRPKAHDYQPPRWTHLRGALDQFAATGDVGDVGENQMSLQRADGDLRFHDWLVSQAGRPDPVGDVLGDYKYGTEQSQDPIARTPEDFLGLLASYGASGDIVDIAHKAIAEWRALR
ncbi:hypothetical protein [Cryobacterium sp. TMT2-14]|uniref:hypothetical protein n=1 Tax=Cryobacterium sp. TMT2-14 TaxID=1259245 RepID=UPI00106C55EC|nr:hypothetical protein [Cryobacterium sp. TMT2-14]TFC38973.1 hypothetical protein E3O28_03835 [Cryobacterium sp. TMT2-14]